MTQGLEVAPKAAPLRDIMGWQGMALLRCVALAVAISTAHASQASESSSLAAQEVASAAQSAGHAEGEDAAATVQADAIASPETAAVMQQKSPLEVAAEQARNGQLDEALRTLEQGLQALPEAWAMHQAIQAIHLRHAARAYAQAVGLPMPPAALTLLPEGAEATSRVAPAAGSAVEAGLSPATAASPATDAGLSTASDPSPATADVAPPAEATAPANAAPSTAPRLSTQP